MTWLEQRFELSRGGGASNVCAMEGVRGFAVSLVFLVHYVTLVHPWIGQEPALNQFARTLHAMGNMGVDLFFVLSGYLIYGSLIARAQPFGRFMARRIKRIYPTFTLVFAVYVLLSLMLPAHSKIPAGLSAGILYLLQNFLLLPGIFAIEPMVTVAWSLSYEMFYYLAIPLVIGVAGLRGREAGVRVLFFMFLAVAYAALCAACGGPIRLAMFISGILLFEWMNGAAITLPPSWVGFIALGLGLLSALFPLDGTLGNVLHVATIFVCFMVFCMACFRNNGNWLAQMFSWWPMRWLGNMSYSYYLLHGLVLKGAFLVLGALMPPNGSAGWLFWALLAPMFALTLVGSGLLFLSVERPISLKPVNPLPP